LLLLTFTSSRLFNVLYVRLRMTTLNKRTWWWWWWLICPTAANIPSSSYWVAMTLITGPTDVSSTFWSLDGFTLHSSLVIFIHNFLIIYIQAYIRQSIVTVTHWPILTIRCVLHTWNAPKFNFVTPPLPNTYSWLRHVIGSRRRKGNGKEWRKDGKEKHWQEGGIPSQFERVFILPNWSCAVVYEMKRERCRFNQSIFV